MDLAPGTVLLGKYRVDEVLGTGGMGKVVRAAHLYLQQSVAIKMLLPHMADSASTVSRFLREAQATVNLKSEHIARVVDVGTMPASGDLPPIPFMVMEYLDGNDLNQILRHHGPQAPPIVVDLMLQACEGMAEAHAMGIVHRDIKPSNFFITRRTDGTMLLKILDFGISKTPAGITDLTNTQTVLGTPTYMAPEQMKTSKGAEARSDIWSMGVVMYQLLTGRPPFSGESYAELVLKVNSEQPAPIMVPLPPGLGEVIMRCLEKNPVQRAQNVGELARSLAPYASDPVSAAQSSARTTRILQQRTAQKGLQALPLTSSGGRATPMPIRPAEFTPRSWPPTSSSISQGAGQVTHRVRGGRGLMIAAIAFLVLLAGAGGFFVSQMLTEDSPTTAANAPAPPADNAQPGAGSDVAVTTPPPATPDLPPPTPTIEDPKAKAEREKAEAKAKADAEAKAKAEAKSKKDADAKSKAEDLAKAKAEARAKSDEEKKAKAEAKAKADAEKKAAALAKAEAVAKAKAEAKAKGEVAVKPKPKPTKPKPKKKEEESGGLFDSRK